MSTPINSTFYKQLNNQYGIDGKLEADHLAFLKSNYQSILYACSDINDDIG